MAKNTGFWLVGSAIALYLIFKNSMANAAPSNGNNLNFAVSQDQLSQTEGFEGFSATAYPDGSDSSGQRYSIGYGHQIQASEGNLLTGSISQDQAQQLLISDMQKVVNVLNNSGQSFTQGQFDALADFGYNEGTGALSKVIAAYVDGVDIPSLLSQYIYWHPVPGGPAQVNENLVSRRNDEITTWNN
jgi:GH24 family phage-related lysozyme (muramidase)